VPIRPRLLAELLMLEPDGAAPLEHKIFVFDGRAQIVWTIFVDHDRARFDAVYSRDWRSLHWRAFNGCYEEPLAPPKQLEKFIELAERLGAGFDHIRVDLYEWEGQPRVGEPTLYTNLRNDRHSLDVMAGLVTASRVYPTCGTRLVRNSGKPELRCHPRL